MTDFESKGTEIFAGIFEEAKQNEEKIIASIKKLTPAQMKQFACVAEEVSQSGIGQDIDGKLGRSFEKCGISPAVITHEQIRKMGEKITPEDYLEEKMKENKLIKNKEVFFINPFSLTGCKVKGRKIECDF